MNNRGLRGCILTRLRAVQQRAENSSPEETCNCTSTQACTVKLYGLLPEQPTRSLPCIKIRFLTDPAYVTWRQYYKKACENVEIRMNETSLSLTTCTTDDERLSAIPCYHGMARCCVIHHLEHIQSSLNLSLDVCEIEMEAASAYAGWLARQVRSDKTPTTCWLKEVECTGAYLEAIRSRLDRVKVARLGYGGTHHTLATQRPSEGWKDKLILQRVLAELPDNSVEDLLTPFPMKRKLTEAELQQEQARLSRLSRNEIELEKVHPERIEFLRYLFEGLKSRASEQVKIIEDEYAQQERDLRGRRRRRSCPRRWLSEEPRRPRPSIQSFFDFLQPRGAGGINMFGATEPFMSYRLRSSRRSRQGGLDSAASQGERRGTVLVRETTMPKRRKERKGTGSSEQETQESTDGIFTGLSDCEGQWN